MEFTLATEREIDLATASGGFLPPGYVWGRGVTGAEVQELAGLLLTLDSETKAIRMFCQTHGNDTSVKLVAALQRLCGDDFDRRDIFVRVGTGLGYDVDLYCHDGSYTTRRVIRGQLEAYANRVAFAGPIDQR